MARKPNLGLKTCDGQQELLRFLRSDIIEVASRLQKGGLGYMDDISEFDEKVGNSLLPQSLPVLYWQRGEREGRYGGKDKSDFL